MAKKIKNAISQNTLCFSTLATSSKVSSEQVNSTNYAGGLSANIAMRCTTKTGMLLLSTFLLLFMFAIAANDVKAGDCPPLLPGQINKWEPWITYGDPTLPNLFVERGWVEFTINNKKCKFYFDICRRKLENPTCPYPFLPLLYEYYISKITPEPGCSMDSFDIIYNYKNIIDAYRQRFAEILHELDPNIICGCEDPDAFNKKIIRVGYPTCITAPYTVIRYVWEPHPSGVYLQVIRSFKTITHCNSYSGSSRCYASFVYCRDKNNKVQIREFSDGSLNIDNCPKYVNVLVDETSSPRTYANMSCYAICSYNYNNYISPQSEEVSSIEEATTTNLSISPNPTNNSTTLTFEVLEAGNLNLILVDASGKEMMELYNATVELGTFTKNFTMSNLPVGVYYLRIALNNKIKMEKVIRN